MIPTMPPPRSRRRTVLSVAEHDLYQDTTPLPSSLLDNTPTTPAVPASPCSLLSVSSPGNASGSSLDSSGSFQGGSSDETDQEYSSEDYYGDYCMDDCTSRSFDDNSTCCEPSEQSFKPSDWLLLPTTTTRPSLQQQQQPTAAHSDHRQYPHYNRKTWQLIMGATGIYLSFLFHGLVQEDLYRYRGPTGEHFSLLWSHQVLESTLAILLGYVGRLWFQGSSSTLHPSDSGGCRGSNGNNNRTSLPLTPLFLMGLAQLTAKTLISKSLEVGVSYPFLTVAKSAKMVPVMLGQFLMGGSSYSARDYILALLLVAGSALLLLAGDDGRSSSSSSSSSSNGPHELRHKRDTFLGASFVLLSLTADGITGGLQKRMQKSAVPPTMYDLLYYSHLTQWIIAWNIGVAVGEASMVPAYLSANPSVVRLVLASSLSSAIGQCFIFFIIARFDALVCTTITTSRKMFTVLLSIALRGHDLTNMGSIGLGLACLALVCEVESQLSTHRNNILQHLAIHTPPPATTPCRKPVLYI
jgi:solute carrier family 35 (UDP-galactose transporter), member B1